MKWKMLKAIGGYGAGLGVSFLASWWEAVSSPGIQPGRSAEQWSEPFQQWEHKTAFKTSVLTVTFLKAASFHSTSSTCPW